MCLEINQNVFIIFCMFYTVLYGSLIRYTATHLVSRDKTGTGPGEVQSRVLRDSSSRYQVVRGTQL